MRRSLMVALTVAALAWLGLGCAHHWERWIDDSYITYRYALNFAEGRGMVFNPGEPVEGITNLGFAILLAPFAASDPLFAARVFGLAGATGALLLLVGWGRRAGFGASALLAALLVYAVPPWVPFAAVQGLETPVVMGLVTLAWARYARERDGGGAPLSGLAMGLGPAMRPDAAMLPILIGIWQLLRGGLRARRVLLSAGVVALCGLGLVGLKLAWYGEILPNTFHAKTGAWPFWGGAQYVLTFLQAPSPAFGLLTLLALALGLGLALRRDDRAIPALVLLTWLAMAWVVNGDFFSNYRLLVPAWPALAAAVGVLVQRLPGRFGPPLGAVVVFAALLPTVPVAELSRPVDRTRFPWSNAQIRERKAPLLAPWADPDFGSGLADAWLYPTAWLLVNTGPNERVGLTDIGLVSYVNANPILDLLGLTDPMFSGKIEADEAMRWDYVSRTAHHLMLDVNKPFFHTWAGRMVDAGWALEAACGPLWFFRNPALQGELNPPSLDEALERSLRALPRVPDMVGVHQALALHLDNRGLDDERLLAFINEAESVAPARAALQYEILRHELDLEAGGTRMPARCTPSDALRPLAEVARDGGWPHVVGQPSTQTDGIRGCEELKDSAKLAWSNLAAALPEDAARRCAGVVALNDDPTAALAEARATTQALEKQLEILERARLHDALRAQEQAWQACRTDRPKNVPRRLREGKR